jgi:hypothetical protein
VNDTGSADPGADSRFDVSVAHMARVSAVGPGQPGIPRQGRATAYLLEGVAPGSFMVISHAGSDLFPREIAEFEKSLNEHLPNDRHVARQRDDVALFFETTTLLAPGVVPVSEWRPGTADEAAVPTTLWGGVGRK